MVIALLLLAAPSQGVASAPALSSEIESALDRLIAFCASDGGAQQIDPAQIDSVAAFVRQTSEMGVYAVQDRKEIRGSSIVYDIERSLSDVIRYAYNRNIPEGAINPSSVNYSFRKEGSGSGGGLPDIWASLNTLTAPQVTRGVVREVISPDLHTGAYYEYDLRRAFVVYRQGTTRVVLSMSIQLGASEVGRKGFIVGDDQDWNYLYTQEEGLDKAGLGWVKSKIYDFFSVCCYVSDDTRPGIVRVGAFQWIGAGWAGLNVVDTHHIRNGLRRYADQFKAMMESRRMPDPAALERICVALEKTDEAVLRQKNLDVTRHLLQKARQDASLGKKEAIKAMDDEAYVAQMDKRQLVSALMREYVKFCLGKETALGSTFWVALQHQGGTKRQPLS
ncbi:MAG: hypothetical protein WAU91_02415 [Desulfatitalea sp.]